MRRFASGWIIAGAFLFQSGVLPAQNTLDTLQEELNDAKQHRQEVAAETLENFFNLVDPAMASPDAAVALYQKAGGKLPDPSPVIIDPTQNEEETATEKEERLAFDQANLARLGTALEVQCGLMHYAATFVVKPDQKGLQADWVNWLKQAAQVYPTLNVAGGDDKSQPEKRKKKRDGDGQQQGAQTRTPFNPTDEEGKAVKDTLIGKFLGFTAWNDKEQGGWSVHDLPKLFRANVLEPLRVKPTAATLQAWDQYIAMMNADVKDNDTWNQVVNPPLQFDRACDDYAVAPGTEKLEGLVGMIKANPTNPLVDDWIARASKLMDDYRASHGGAPAAGGGPAPAAVTNTSPTNPNVTITTVQDGDATIITTHTNSAPVNPPH